MKTQIDVRFSDPDATPTPWAEVEQCIAAAELFWIATVRKDGRPHVTPVPTVWRDSSLYFCTGPGEQKAVNLAANARCALTTGTNEWKRGLDVVVEGESLRITDEDELRKLADLWREKYDGDWDFTVADGAFHHGDGGTAYVFRVAPDKVLAFAKGAFAQTRYTW